MSRYVVKLRDRYVEWSTVADAPITEGMTREVFREYYLTEYGKHAERELNESLRRADETGSSAISAWRTHNRAGPEETTLTEDELYQVYCLGQPLDGQTVRAKLGARQVDQPSPARPPTLSPDAAEAEIRAAFDSLMTGSSFEDVRAIFDPGESVSRKRGPWKRFRWEFDTLIIQCTFDKQSGALCGHQVLPKRH